jgi:hypothetical protein
MKGWFGKAMPRVGHAPRAGEIRINCLLNSEDVSRATLRFLLYHEFLHLHLQQNHTPTFRDLERRWPGYRDADREMDNLNERFALEFGVKTEPLQY